jgi:hypothetical protein
MIKRFHPDFQFPSNAIPIPIKEGKIYEIVCETSGKRYIGSTTKSLPHRLSIHKSHPHHTTACGIIEGGTYSMNLLEEYSYTNDYDLKIKEYEWMEKLDCVNKIRGKGRSITDKKATPSPQSSQEQEEQHPPQQDEPHTTELEQSSPIYS